ELVTDDVEWSLHHPPQVRQTRLDLEALRPHGANIVDRSSLEAVEVARSEHRIVRVGQGSTAYWSFGDGATGACSRAATATRAPSRGTSRDVATRARRHRRAAGATTRPSG